MQEDEAARGLWTARQRRLTLGMLLTVTMVAFESLAVSTVLPLINRDLHEPSLYGWVFSAFFLSSLLGIVLAGGLADRGGLSVPLLIGLGTFAAGLLGGGLAPSMPVLVGSRVLQGFGAGMIPALSYVVIGRAYEAHLRPRMFAVLSTAWVLPGILGPAVAGFVADRVGWRWVFLGLLPMVVIAGLLTIGPFARVPAPASPAHGAVPMMSALGVACGAALVLAGLTVTSPLLTIVLLVAGLCVGLPRLRRLLPPGTFRCRPGLPAAVATRGLLTGAFFAADAFVPYTMTTIKGTSATIAGLALTCSTMLWTLGAWIQQRNIDRSGPRFLVRLGFGLVAVAVVLMSLTLVGGVSYVMGPLAWAVGGLGIGLAYSSLSLTVLHEAAPGHEGEASSSLQLTDVLGSALGAGVAGAAVSFGHVHHWEPRIGLVLAFGIAAAVAGVGYSAARRLPRLLVVR